MAVNIGRFLEFRTSITYKNNNEINTKYNTTEIQIMSPAQNNVFENDIATQSFNMNSSATSESKDSASLQNR